VEELPKYTVHPPLPDRGEKNWKEALRRKWWILPIIIVVIIAAIIGGVIGNNHRRKEKSEQAADASNDPPAPLITALTATECVAGTFVFYQVNTNEIYLYGQLWSGYWNNKLSRDIPSINLNLRDTNLRPYYGSNLTAVCYVSRDESADEDTIVSVHYMPKFARNLELLQVLRLFYLAMPLIFNFPLVEATITIPFTQWLSNSITNPVPSPISITQQVIANVTNASSLSACYIEYWGLELYYLDSPPSTGKSNMAPATITQLYWNETELWSNKSIPLNATAFNSGAALTVACVGDLSVTPETHILYMNEDNVLSQLRFMNETWGSPSVITNADSQPSLTGITNMAAIAPYIGPTQLYLYYVLDHRPQQTIILIDKATGLNSLYSVPYSPADLPDAIQAPPLIAATTRLDAIGNQPQKSIFYVWRSNSTAKYMNKQGSMIVNMTTAPPPDQDGWLQDGSTMEGQGY
jgi:hypothetical protein